MTIAAPCPSRSAQLRRAVLSAGAILILAAAGTGRAAPEVGGFEYTQVMVAGTTDLHGHIYPLDYYTNRPEASGLAKVSTVLQTLRLEDPHLLLLDSGDTLQGTPLEYYHNRVDNGPLDPMMRVMNALHYDAMAVGNHDYNYGLQVQAKARREAAFPWLSANTYKVGTNETAFAPYLIKEVNGVRVGVLGLTTPEIPSWETPANYAGLEFRDPVAEAQKWVSILKQREHVDVIVVAMHMGLEQDLSTGETPPSQLAHENYGLAIAEAVPGVDLILLGHTHRELSSLTVNGVLLAQADLWGERVVRADLYLRRTPGGPWQVWAKQAKTIVITKDTAADPAVLQLAASYHQAAQAWLDRKIGESAQPLSAEDARVRSTAIIDLVQRAQLEAGHADVAMTAPFNLAARIPLGPVSVRDIYGIYIYDNTLVVIEVTGQQLKDALEHSARYFKPYVPGKTPADLIDYRIPAFNFDIAAGVNYVIDLTRPPGDRIRDLQFQGAPLDPARKLRLATNNYRITGGGGYTMLKGAPVLSRSSDEIRNLIIDWVERHRQIPTEPLNNWRIIPPQPAP
jgi:2',3'-cyclic-nucleotide 2'-phosphodiesterase (5'-nucleotidase family)